ncbi:putative pyridoxal kinase BUD16 [Candida viswanathii]|uniref:pyridoxal kinase n=1 Tax=Candida viswanathii TaxID=5486 RepID=A0A367XR30_9ASCO|nr:putative pyridoxal kinase BUD16 [Candida viswanathii]
MKSVLSIQSHVAHGYVGGRAAIFPLQTQGWEVDNINTVSFSNHTGYGSFMGTSLQTDELDEILAQLIRLDIKYSAIITGYIPNSALIYMTSKYVQEFKKLQPGLVYLLDPVMGDNNYLYVDKSCVKEYQSILKSKIVDIITPNQFELELLTNIKIINKFSLVQAIKILHEDYDIPYVVVTSVSGEIFDDDCIHCVISTKYQPIRTFSVPTIKSYFTGVGDLFSALLLDKMDKNKGVADQLERLSRAVNQVLTIMAKTLKLTHRLGIQQALKDEEQTSGGAHGKTITGQMNNGDTMKYFELKVIQAKEYYDYDGDGEFVESLLDV